MSVQACIVGPGSNRGENNQIYRYTAEPYRSGVAPLDGCCFSALPIDYVYGGYCTRAIQYTADDP